MKSTRRELDNSAGTIGVSALEPQEQSPESFSGVALRTGTGGCQSEDFWGGEIVGEKKERQSKS